MPGRLSGFGYKLSMGEANGAPAADGGDYLERDRYEALVGRLDADFFFAELKRMYKRRMLPLELASRFGHFASPPLGPADFDAKPLVLLLGPYSVGKTSFVRALLGRDVPGSRIGPEPTTDRFVVVSRSDDGVDRLVPGNALALRPDRPFGGLQGFGNAFLDKLAGAEVAGAPALDNLTLVDTPGVLSGEKQRVGRDYDFPAVVRWFADRADLVLLLFDAHKLDVSDELKRAVDALRGHDGKVRVVLNKADAVDPRELLRVHGALLWQLGRVLRAPEAPRVRLGAFGAAPPDARAGGHAAVLAAERADLLRELGELPRHAVLRRVNDLGRRARRLKVHAYLIHHLRNQMPRLFGRDDAQARLLDDLPRRSARNSSSRFGTSRPNASTRSLGRVDVDSADLRTNRSLSSSARRTANEAGPTRSMTRALTSGGRFDLRAGATSRSARTSTASRSATSRTSTTSARGCWRSRTSAASPSSTRASSPTWTACSPRTSPGSSTGPSARARARPGHETSRAAARPPRGRLSGPDESREVPGDLCRRGTAPAHPN